MLPLDRCTWLTMLPTFVNGTELSSHKWRDSFLLRYSLSPLGLPLFKCAGCGDDFSINHALKCKHGGLIILRHDEVTRELIELGTTALRPAAVRDESLITPVPKQHPNQTNNPNTTINPPVDDRGKTKTVPLLRLVLYAFLRKGSKVMDSASYLFLKA
jgi:hypothetical protein